MPHEPAAVKPAATADLADTPAATADTPVAAADLAVAAAPAATAAPTSSARACGGSSSTAGSAPLRVMLGMVTSCHVITRKPGRDYSYVIPVEPTTPPRRRLTAATCPDAARAGARGEGDGSHFYKAVVLSVLSHVHLNAWVDAWVEPGTLCCLDERVVPGTRRTKHERLRLLLTDTDVAAWAHDVTARPDQRAWLAALRATPAPGARPFTPAPLARTGQLESLVTTFGFPVLLARAKPPVLLEESDSMTIAELCARHASPPRPAVPQGGCLPPVWIDVSGAALDELKGLRSVSGMMGALAQAYHPAAIYGSRRAAAAFTATTTMGFYSPTVFVMLVREGETVVACFTTSSNCDPNPSEAARQPWRQHGDVLQVTDPVARKLLRDVTFHLNPRRLVVQDGRPTLTDFASRAMAQPVAPDAEIAHCARRIALVA